MKHIYLTIISVILLLWGCNNREYSDPGPSLIYLDFNNKIENSGILPVEFRGEKYVSFAEGIKDTSLDLSINAQYRKPVIIEKGPANSFGDYEGLTILLWVKAARNDPMRYVMAGQQIFLDNHKFKGWNISKTEKGGWCWEFSDGQQTLRYAPPRSHQPLDDKKWHQVGFAIDKRQQEARLFYDGDLKAILSLESVNIEFPGTALSIGADPLAENPVSGTFNGMIDEVGVWSRVLDDTQVSGVYTSVSGKKLKPLKTYTDSLTIMTWNIANGGELQGKFVGIQRIAGVIRNSGADIVSLQETMNAGEILAGELDYYLYRRSKNLSILSRFHPVKSFNVFRSDHSGALEVAIDNQKSILVAPVWLSQQPDLAAYVAKSDARTDTIEVREMETRGREANFILSEMRPFLINANQIPVVIAGDFNSGSHLDWTDRNQEKHNGLIVDFPATRFMTEAGLSDAFRIIRPDEVSVPGHTWSPIYQEGLQTRMDFIYYMGKMLTPSTAEVIDSTEFDFPSDHAAVVVSFRVQE
ncbi:LamG-like jellyroll fold domain-containing protein [Marinilabilia salmonicolor]|jgi:endonuclease/exonuclease/phosphatase family metal-dependent hydrolase|uniref:Endonuclease/exonuclease/phosphatase family metal-dependent hydrolase n=1 Tax=Marinilabilia salmonicolor TaxID=989 RepID=A0A368UNP4_9BACT|nr:endonuclease/exonuclease/phosphatase family protein [Marinilabilia salmonicolor]RCW30417.1 endonuclease/exonuclease/phosphatase family metal-dependent hydrolase [Marinilabilia salmonicolor]